MACKTWTHFVLQYFAVPEFLPFPSVISFSPSLFPSTFPKCPIFLIFGGVAAGKKHQDSYFYNSDHIVTHSDPRICNHTGCGILQGSGPRGPRLWRTFAIFISSISSNADWESQSLHLTQTNPQDLEGTGSPYYLTTH